MYQYYTDPGHGWVKVSIEELEKLGIEKQISTCSYMKNGFEYPIKNYTLLNTGFILLIVGAVLAKCTGVILEAVQG